MRFFVPDGGGATRLNVKPPDASCAIDICSGIQIAQPQIKPQIMARFPDILDTAPIVLADAIVEFAYFPPDKPNSPV